ncbi:MAG: 30S ribosome-binding factor RbfA [Patescibacteria group bacterium]|nr:30S ribosome-binding factor RbfA [Patescibacteria group bacterium]
MRIEKINKLIKKEVGNIILEEVNFSPSVMVTVKDVSVSKDLRYADVFVSVFPFEKNEEVQALLKENIYEMQRILNKKLVMKPLPRIVFKIDDTGEYVGRIDKLINENKL